MIVINYLSDCIYFLYYNLYKIDRICETTNQAIQELEQKKRQMNRELENLKKELTFIKNPADCKILLERVADIMVSIKLNYYLAEGKNIGDVMEGVRNLTFLLHSNCFVLDVFFILVIKI